MSKQLTQPEERDQYNRIYYYVNRLTRDSSYETSMYSPYEINFAVGVVKELLHKFPAGEMNLADVYDALGSIDSDFVVDGPSHTDLMAEVVSMVIDRERRNYPTLYE